ncbi:hypothetical protein B0H13DRAFT_1867907 [Mycena leptocephala]|nr:hypothetical protein B0H13DRAFT_1867907 [Mycena leptocephala]
MAYYKNISVPRNTCPLNWRARIKRDPSRQIGLRDVKYGGRIVEGQGRSDGKVVDPLRRELDAALMTQNALRMEALRMNTLSNRTCFENEQRTTDEHRAEESGADRREASIRAQNPVTLSKWVQVQERLRKLSWRMKAVSRMKAEQIRQNWVQKIEQQDEGQVKVTFKKTGTLINAPEFWNEDLKVTTRTKYNLGRAAYGN